MNVLIVGAGASFATQRLPMAATALAAWRDAIIGDHPHLALALERWVGHNWPTVDLETAWSRIDFAWTERLSGASSLSLSDLTHRERGQVWSHAVALAA